LTSLVGFPKLPKLIRLELTDNKINGGQLANLSHLTELQSLSLGGNPIATFDDLSALIKLNKLIQLDLFGCPVSEDGKYREKVFIMFPSLQILDNKDKEGVEVDYDEDDDYVEDFEGEGEGDDDAGEEDEAEGLEEESDDEDGGEEGGDDEDSDDDDEEIERKATQNKKVKKN